MYIVDKFEEMINFTNVDAPQAGLRVINTGLHHTSPGHTFGPAVRSYYLIHFIVRGRGQFFADGRTHALREGQCFMIRPMQVTTYRADPDDPWLYYWLAFAGGEADALVQSVFPREPVGTFDPFELSDLKRAMRDEPKDHVHFDLKLRHSLHALLLSAYRSTGVTRTETDVIQSARRYIAANYDRAFDITQLAGELGYTRAHFTTMFAKAVGMPPHAYLIQYRLERARSLLREKPELTVTEIAFSVGFNSIERFSAAFKRQFGIPPRRARD